MPGFIPDWQHVLSVLVVIGELIAFVTLGHIVMRSRSATAAWGWGMAVIALPFAAIPLYLILGRKQFKGYLERRREAAQSEQHQFARFRSEFEPYFAKLTPRQSLFGEAIDRLSERRFTQGNEITLQLEGQYYDEISEAIGNARAYILCEFFIIKADETGAAFSDALCAKAKEGIKVCLLVDGVGCYRIPRAYHDKLRRAGVEVAIFKSSHGKINPFQINFRNHRKILIVDGEIAFCGGHNIANEYQGTSPHFGVWRDTSVKMGGPAVMSLQIVFLEDWYWATRNIPALNWTKPAQVNASKTVMTLPFGPVEPLEAGLLFFLDVITRAERRLWIASPYFVPDAAILSALQLAALRGVDVRVMMPSVPDKWLPWLASFSFLEEMELAGVKVFRYGEGFLHQKVLLVDDDLASVGTANLDNRSMRLNFEVNIIVLDEGFCRETEAMLLRDLAVCKAASANDYRNRPWWFRLAVRLARLAAPLL